MWRSGKELANTSSALGRVARHTVSVAPLAGPATFTWGRVPTHRRLNASHVFLRSYAQKPGELKPEKKLSTSMQQLESLGLLPTDSRGIDNFLSGPDMSHATWMPQEKPPAVSFGLRRTLETMTRSISEGIYRLSGYSSDSKSIEIHFEHQEHQDSGIELSPLPMKLSKFYLRDVCQCRRCVCPSTGQKTFATCDVPDAPRVLDPQSQNIRLSADGSLEITWKDDFLTGNNHTSVYPEKFLNCLAQTKGRETFPAHHRVKTWDAATFERDMGSRQIGFLDWMEGGAEFAQAVLNLREYGLVFMHGVPRSEDSVRKIAEKIGHLQSTPRGLTWDVISEPGGGIAASNEGLHQDMLHLNDQPEVQFHHYLENESLGNMALFSDGLYAAQALKEKDNSALRTLRSQMVNYRQREGGLYFLKRRHVIRTNNHGSPISIAWSPASQGPFNLYERSDTLTSEESADWSRAARAFRNEVESSKNVVAYTPRPGDCVVFDSRRILHGSKQVTFPAGRKHLRGAYVDSQTLRSAFVELVEKGLLTRRTPYGVVFGPSEVPARINESRPLYKVGGDELAVMEPGSSSKPPPPSST